MSDYVKSTCELYGYGCPQTGNYKPLLPPIRLGKIIVDGKEIDLDQFQQPSYDQQLEEYNLATQYTNPAFGIDLNLNSPVVKTIEQQVRENENVDYSGPYNLFRDSWYRVANAESWYELYPGTKTRLVFVKEQLDRINKIGSNILKEIDRIAAEAGTSNTNLLKQVGGTAAGIGGLVAATPVGVGLLIAGVLSSTIAQLIDVTKANSLSKRIGFLQFELGKLNEYYVKYLEELEKLEPPQSSTNTILILGTLAAALKYFS